LARQFVTHHVISAQLFAAVRKVHSITSSASEISVGGNCEAERLGGFLVDDQLELGLLRAH
jgi:hypothetical protein